MIDTRTTERTEMTKHYFAVDGNFGNAEGLVTIDTSDWTEDEWFAIDDASDSDRIRVALELAEAHDEEIQPKLPGF
jgi:hypothetical protein